MTRTTNEKAIEDAASAIASECLAMRVRYLNRSLTSIYNDAFRPLGITASQVNMLVGIVTQEALSPSALGKVLNIEKSTLSRNLERMRKAGWIEIETSNPGRGHLIRASGSGRALLLDILPLWQQAQQSTHDLLGQEQSEAMRLIGDHARIELSR